MVRYLFYTIGDLTYQSPLVRCVLHPAKPFQEQRLLYNIARFTLCTQTVFLLRSCISHRATIIYIYNINRTILIIETECVYCAVRTGYLNTNHVIFIRKHLIGETQT